MPRRLPSFAIAHHHKIRESMFDFDGGARAAADRCAGHPQASANDLIIQAIWAECAGDDLWGAGRLGTDVYA
ncbi:hypothetical protein THF1C08_330031 [Vibrio jasicida]|nr:hypothetical protein THF1C08_330031 [Vibrio jasicida]